MLAIRDYHASDAQAVGRLIADTYSAFNLSFATEAEKALLLGPFRHARSNEPVHKKAIAEVISAAIVFVAEADGQIVGVLRGRPERLQSLFVQASFHRQGIGRRLVERFECECLRQGATVIRVASSLYAVPFYLALGYKRSTGVRPGWSFEGSGLQVQPMRKVLCPSDGHGL
jgi:GNAT superfamily N-acetyltransferase